MPASLATWENLEQLRQQFPFAPAWGHAGSQGRVNVSTVPHTEPDPTTEHAGEEEAGPSKWEPKESRKRRPNTLVIGPTWKN